MINEDQRIRISVPEDAPLCSVRYKIIIFKDGQADPYASEFFDLDITA
jgi:hypothetical protein